MKRKAIIYTVNALAHHEFWGTAFRDGLIRHGWDAKLSNEYEPCDLLAMWGVNRKTVMEKQTRSGGELCILERGYIGDRFKYSSASFGGKLNGRANFRGPFTDASRWEKKFSHLMHPWRSGGEYILVLGQVFGDASIEGVDIIKFYNSVREAFERQGYKVRFRPHPQQRSNTKPVKIERVVSHFPLEEDLRLAIAAVTYNSNSGVDAALLGIPTIAMDEGSMAWPVAGHSFEVPPQCDRLVWAHAMAWKQWSLEEMASGDCWAHISEEMVAT